MSTAPFLAPGRDDRAKLGRAVGSGTTHYWVPGAPAESTTNWNLTANTDVYVPFHLDSPILVDQFIAQVGGTGATNFRIGAYAADVNLQPVGPPLFDSGNLASGSTGMKVYTPGSPVYLPAGRYLSAINSDNSTASITAFQNAGNIGVGFNPAGGTTMLASFSVGRAYGAFPTPGTAWTAVTSANYGWRQFLMMRVLGA